MIKNNSSNVSPFAPKGKVKVVNGTILAPENAGLRVILNILGMSGKTDSNMFTLFDKKWKKVKEESKGWYSLRTNFKLGFNNQIAVQSDTWVINMLCKNEENVLDEPSLDVCLKKASDMAKYEKATVHVSEILLQEHPLLAEKFNVFTDNGVSVYVYQEKA